MIYVRTKNNSSHQVGGDKLVGIPLPQRPAVGKVSDRGPQRDVIRVLVPPPRERVFHELHESWVVVVVNGVPVDVPENVPHPGVRRVLVEVSSFEVASLDPEVLGGVEGCTVEFSEGAIAGHEDVPLDDGQGVVV